MLLFVTLLCILNHKTKSSTRWFLQSLPALDRETLHYHKIVLKTLAQITSNLFGIHIFMHSLSFGFWFFLNMLQFFSIIGIAGFSIKYTLHNNLNLSLISPLSILENICPLKGTRAAHLPPQGIFLTAKSAHKLIDEICRGFFILSVKWCTIGLHLFSCFHFL